MTPAGKIAVGLVATSVVAAAAHMLTRAPLLSDLGGRSAAAMADNGITDGRTNWVSDSGWTFRIARISGTADAATRARTLAAVTALPGIHAAVWVDALPVAGSFDGTPLDCRRRVAAIMTARPVTFAADGSELAAGDDTVIDALALVLRNCPAVRVDVIGHAAPTANPLYTLALSQARAEAVVEALTRRGIDVRMLEPIGLGATQNNGLDSIEMRVRDTKAVGTPMEIAS